MPAVKISIPSDQDIVRVFFRYPKQTTSFDTLVVKDFARRLETESGISLLRIGPSFSKAQALSYVPSRKLKGLAICKASELVRLGLIFIAKSDSDPHITARCFCCNLTYSPAPLVCICSDGSQCPLALDAIDSLAQRLTDVFSVDTPVKL
jgi:hypothetical protein